MKKNNISNLLQSISVLATLRVIVNGNYSTILEHLQQKLIKLFHILFFYLQIRFVKRKEKEKFNEQNEKFQFNELIPKKMSLNHASENRGRGN